MWYSLSTDRDGLRVHRGKIYEEISNNKAMRTDYYLVKDKILFALQNTQRNKSVTTDFIYSFIEELIKQGWERKDIYELVLDIQNNHHTSVSQETIEILYELATSLSGYCAAECIYRFPNEPKDCKELQDYVLGNNWKTS